MPWKETCAMNEKMRFIVALEEQEENFSEVCRRFGISRPTGYKWVERYEQEGVDGLREHSRAPQTHPNAVPQEVEDELETCREKHPNWGARKIRTDLEEKEPWRHWPAASTIHEVLKRRGLIPKRKKRQHTPPYEEPFAACDAPNAVWCIDFKGWFRTGDGQRCDPLTISDAHTRFLLKCQIVSRPDGAHVKAQMEVVFREYGLPCALRSDNGPPFAGVGLRGLSRLSVWWLRLGITPERIAPGKPQQNGRHERMHRTLKQETATPPQDNLRSQQRAFDRFREEYNYDRPHEALGQRPPGSLYVASATSYPEYLPEPVYPEHFERRVVEEHGQFKFRGRRFFLSYALAGEPVGLEPLDDDQLWLVHFCSMPLAILDWKEEQISPWSPAQQTSEETEK